MLNENNEVKSASNLSENKSDEHLSQTSENNVSAEKKWDHFLNTYRKYYHTEFDWIKYIRDCRLYQKNFSIKEFLATYGQPAVNSFLKCKEKILADKKAEKMQTHQNTTTNKQDTKNNFKVSRIFTSFLEETNDTIKLELRNNINEMRYLMLIQFLTPQTKLEKKAFRKWMRLCRKQKLTKREAYSRYLLIDDETLVNTNIPRHKLISLVDRQKEIINYETKVKNEKQIVGITTTSIDNYRSPAHISTPEKNNKQKSSSKNMFNEIKNIEL